MPRSKDHRKRYATGVAYAKGDGVPLDRAEALRWLIPLAEVGCLDSQFYVAVCMNHGWGGLQQDVRGALSTFLGLADLGHVKSRHNAACILIRDDSGIPSDPARAVEMFRACRDHPLSEYCLGSSYAKGIGVPRDDALAKYWFERAASHGYPSKST